MTTMDSDEDISRDEEKHYSVVCRLLVGGMPGEAIVGQKAEEISALLSGMPRTHILVVLAAVIAGWVRSSPFPVTGVRMVSALAIKGLCLDKQQQAARVIS